MANRRRLDSSHFIVATNSKITTSHLQLRQVLLTLAFVSSLLSIHCASFNQHSVNKRQAWPHNQPEYRISLATKVEPFDQDEVLNEWSRPISGYNIGARLPTSPLESMQQTGAFKNKPDQADYYLASPKHVADFSFNEDDRKQQEKQFYQELALARLFDSTKQQEEQRQLSLFDNNNILPLSQNYDYQPLPNSDLSLSSSNLLDYEQPNYNSKQVLAELLQSNSNKRVFGNNRQIPNDFETNFKLQYNPNSPLNLSPPDQSPVSSLKSDTFDDQLVYQKDNVNDESQQNKVLDESRLFDNTDNARKDYKNVNSPRKFTTLLEDEGIETSTSPNNSSSSSSNLKDIGSNQQVSGNYNKLSEAASSESLNDIHYGKVVNNATSGYSLNSMLSSIYNKFANLLPLSKDNEMTAKIASKRDGHSSRQMDEGKSSEVTYGNIVEGANNDNKSSILSTFKGLFNKVANYLTISNEPPTVRVRELHSSGMSTGKLNTDSKELNTKLSVSKSGPIESSKGVKSDRDNQDDKQTKDRQQQQQQQTLKLSTNEESNDDANLNGGINNSDNDNSLTSEENNNSKDNENYMSGGASSSSNQQQRQASGSSLPIDSEDSESRVSLLRRSSLVLPSRSDDDPIFVEHTTNSDELINSGRSVGLLGYYAPESRHYQFDTTPLKANPNKAGLDEQQVYSQLSHRSYSHRLHPGDDVYGSYSELRPIFATHAGPHETLSLIPNNKTTNDMYFLIMVSAFCVMAVAVVLAAGMFAYRVQQNRKLATETDYPTYGVVGPNSMNTKCGAAGLVGGYFGSIKRSNSSSTKNSADINSGSDSGVTTSCKQTGAGATRSPNDQANNLSNGSFNNRSDFLAGQNAARMYHYQHQKQQMIISDRRQTSASDSDSEDDNDDGSYTVYECPGLASAHEIEIKNPLFNS